MSTEVDRDQKLAHALLMKVGKSQLCRGPDCGQPIFMVRHMNGEFHPYNADGSTHFGTCPNADLFRRSRR